MSNKNGSRPAKERPTRIIDERLMTEEEVAALPIVIHCGGPIARRIAELHRSRIASVEGRSDDDQGSN
jgi:hypothetical protein